MDGYYTGKIKVVTEDLMCFPVRPDTLEPLACSCYDPWAWTHPDPEPLKTITADEWQRRRSDRQRRVGDVPGRRPQEPCAYGGKRNG